MNHDPLSCGIAGDFPTCPGCVADLAGPLAGNTGDAAAEALLHRLDELRRLAAEVRLHAPHHISQLRRAVRRLAGERVIVELLRELLDAVEGGR